jgi:soluble lytic murein transglycosylase
MEAGAFVCGRDRRRTAIAWLALVWACDRQGAATVATATSPMPSTSAVAAAPRDATAGDPGGPVASVSWPTLVREERWDAAWRALETLPEPEKVSPELRYVRARVALERGQAGAALPLLEGLETALPLLAEDIGRRRAEAKLAVGPFAEAGEWFAARASPAAQVDAARAFEKAGQPHRARSAIDRVLSAEKRTREQEAAARALRVRIADPAGDVERGDARWLATQGADLPAAADAQALVAKLDPAHPLTAQELLLRARVLSEAGRADDALHAIEAAAAPGQDRLVAAERVRARGMALYRAKTRYGDAARALAESAAAGGPHAAEDTFLAARALSRADRDEEAISGYEDVQRRFAKTQWAEQAAFYAPYLRMLHGQWKECARGFEAYLRMYPGGQDARDARRDGALCSLQDGDAKVARAGFERLVDDETDPVASARMANMAALAAMRDGDRTHAVARWTDVAQTRPLTWPGMVARARLADAGAPLPARPASPDDAADAGPAISVALPPPADMLQRLGLDDEAEIALREREGAVTSAAGARSSEALCAAYGLIGRARRRYQIAQSLPSSLFATALLARTRWAWECAYPSPYADAIRESEVHENLPGGLLWAVMRQESGFDPDAVSPAHAVGLMQLLPDTARILADEMGLPKDDARLTSPPYAIQVGAHGLRKLLDEFHGDVALAVAAYNGGAESVERWLARAPGMNLDTFVERIPYRETREYVSRVMGNLAHYGYLAQGEAGVPQVSLELRQKN